MIKNLTVYLPALLAAVFLFTSCKYDNYDPPQIAFSGQLLYNGKPFMFDGRGDGDLSKIIQLSQYGFGKSGNPITAYVNEQGRFNQLLFPGDYHITIKNTPYPFTFPDWPRNAGNQYDTLHVNINRNYNIDINVVPYFEVTDVTSKVFGTDLIITFRINKIKEGATLVKARAFANTAELVNSGVRMSAEQSLTNVDITQPVQIKLSLIDYRNKFVNNFRDYMYFRVALETTVSTAYFLWSDTYEATGLPVQFNDVTATYLKNYQQSFTVGDPLPVDPGRRFVLPDWLYTPGMQNSMFDGWSDRRFMSAENWGGPALTGAVWQAPTLPAGKYVLVATRGWNNGDLHGGANRAYVAIATGAALSWNSSTILQKADCSLAGNTTAVTVPFELTAESQVSIGYMVNFPTGETNALSFISWKLIKAD
ncbi:MAG TPA: DUF3823 domain-containing protein [Niabella sp.]